MAGPGAGADRRAVEYASSPKGYLWVAVCLGTAGAILGASTLLGVGELLYATKQLLLEAFFITS